MNEPAHPRPTRYADRPCRARARPTSAGIALTLALGCPACSLVDSPDYLGPPPVEITLSVSGEGFEFGWESSLEATVYKVLESVTGDGEHFEEVGSTQLTVFTHEVPLHLRLQASYVVDACVGGDCSRSGPTFVAEADAVGRLTAPSEMGPERLGVSVALSADGDAVAVGARRDDGAGAVYLFTRAAEGWSQPQRVTVDDSGAYGFFGETLALCDSADTLAVGASGEDEGTGAIYVFTRDGGAWSRQPLVPPEALRTYDYFGRSVALSGGDCDTLAVGAPGAGGGAGAVYLFTRDAGEWSQIGEPAAAPESDPDPDSEPPPAAFGGSVALSKDGQTLAVGASGEDNQAGAAYVFTRAGEDWAEPTRFTATSPTPAGYFGQSVALSKDDGPGLALAVGASGEDALAGAAYVFVQADEGWREPVRLTAANPAMGDKFGESVTLTTWRSAWTLIVTAPHTDSDGALESGAVYVFRQTTEDMSEDMTWAPQSYIEAPSPEQEGGFGSSVGASADGVTLAVGARSDGATGAVYLYP